MKTKQAEQFADPDGHKLSNFNSTSVSGAPTGSLLTFCQERMHTLLIVFVILSTWKVVRTDWLVICPWEAYGNSSGSPSGWFDATFHDHGTDL